MERLTQRRDTANKALLRLQDSLNQKEHSTLERDGIIQRFEFSFELLWKAAKAYLWEREGIDIASPKTSIRSCHDIGLLSDDETERLLAMVDERNLTSQTYDEEFAAVLFQRIPEHLALLRLSGMTVCSNNRNLIEEVLNA